MGKRKIDRIWIARAQSFKSVLALLFLISKYGRGIRVNRRTQKEGDGAEWWLNFSSFWLFFYYGITDHIPTSLHDKLILLSSRRHFGKNTNDKIYKNKKIGVASGPTEKCIATSKKAQRYYLNSSKNIRDSKFEVQNSRNYQLCANTSTDSWPIPEKSHNQCTRVTSRSQSCPCRRPKRTDVIPSGRDLL